MNRFMNLLWLFLLVSSSVADFKIQQGWQNFTINANGKATTVRYPLGLDTAGLRGIAGELAEKLQLNMGYGCSDRACLIDTLAGHLLKQEPKSLDEWLYKSGWKTDQVAVLHDVMNINYWHFAMLNDVDRNEKFDKAIRGAVHRAKARRRLATSDDKGGGGGDGDSVCVIDLGSGSGLLAMMASRAGADMVHAVEQSALLSAVGPGIMRRNGFKVRVAGSDGSEKKTTDGIHDDRANDKVVYGESDNSDHEGADHEGWSDPWPCDIQWLHRKSTDVTLKDLAAPRAGVASRAAAVQAAVVVEEVDAAAAVEINSGGQRRCDVLVSETLGVSVLDEAGLGFMADVRDRLILTPRQGSHPLSPPSSSSSSSFSSSSSSSGSGGAADTAGAGESGANGGVSAGGGVSGVRAGGGGGGPPSLSPSGGGGEVVPVRVTTMAAVVRCDSLHQLSFVDKASGFDLGVGMNGFRDTKVN
jgi:hypothetical protein